VKYCTIFLFILLFFYPAAETECFSIWPKGPHRIYLGPDSFHLKRTKKGGAKQKGWLNGVYGAYERRPHGGVYTIFDGYYAQGSLKGETAAGNTLKSKMTDKKIEGRLGYSFCIQSWKKLTLIPYGGYGYSNCKNAFKAPSPLTNTYTEYFNYASAGFEISFSPCNALECGLNFNTDFMIEGKSKIEDDVDDETFRLLIENKNQYEIDLLFRYYTHYNEKAFTIIASPFYQQRHYGGMKNFPFDFIDTKFQIFGIRLLINLCF